MFFVKMVISSAVISFSSWLAGQKPALAGFIVALPISSMLVIAMTQAEWRDPEKSTELAKNILFSIPLSLTFFLPFLFSRSLKLPFWGTYALGVVLLALSYLIHRRFFPDST